MTARRTDETKATGVQHAGDIVERFDRIVSAALFSAAMIEEADVEAVRAALAERAPGWRLVPVEPDLHMVVAGGVALTNASQGDIEATVSELTACYRAMLAAAPTKEST